METINAVAQFQQPFPRRRITVRTPIQGGHEVTTYAMQKPARRDMRSPFPPAWPWHVEPELGLLKVFVDIVEAQAGRGQQTGPCLECNGQQVQLESGEWVPSEIECEICEGSGRRSHAGDAKAMAAAFESALRRLEAREQGRLSAADRKRDGEPIYVMSDEVRALFGQADPIRALIGGTEDERWQPGLAALTKSEQEAYWLHLHGLSRTSIALAMAPARAKRFGRAGALPVDTVSKYLWRARVKLRGVFVQALESELEYLAELDAEETQAALQRRNVDPARAQPRPLAAYPLPGEEDFSEPSMPEDEENPEGEPWLP